MLCRMNTAAFALSLSMVLLVGVDAAPAPKKAKPSRPLRVLLFASSAAREYQFLRMLLVRETDAKRAELSIYLQPAPGREKPRAGVVQDVPKERLLETFPTKLNAYDVIVAFDPDWTRLAAQSQTALRQWVREKAGGLVLIAGPVNTLHLARPVHQRKLAPIIDLYPVVVIDPRLLETAIDTSKPRRLTFPKTKAKYLFLKLDSKSKDDLAGWARFFDGENAGKDKKDRDPRDGFFSYHPIESVKPDAVVLAALVDPKARMKNGKDQPYLVARQVEKGRVLYVGSGELWRLRTCRREFYERCWLTLLEYLSTSRSRSARDR